MSLQLDYTKIAKWEEVCFVDHPTLPGKRVEDPWNFTMGIFMIHTGIRTLTYDNAPEFYMRAKLIEVNFGSLFTNGDGTHRYIEAADVIAYIGLTSNVNSYTEAQFFGHLRKDVIHNLRQTMKFHLREHEKEIKAKVLAADPELRKLSDG